MFLSEFQNEFCVIQGEPNASPILGFSVTQLKNNQLIR